jgi:hypothetical protein
MYSPSPSRLSVPGSLTSPPITWQVVAIVIALFTELVAVAKRALIPWLPIYEKEIAIRIDSMARTTKISISVKPSLFFFDDFTKFLFFRLIMNLALPGFYIAEAVFNASVTSRFRRAIEFNEIAVNRAITAGVIEFRPSNRFRNFA